MFSESYISHFFLNKQGLFNLPLKNTLIVLGHLFCTLKRANFDISVHFLF